MQKIILNVFSKRISKAIIDILLIVGLILTLITSRSAESSWWSFHCVASMIWYLLMIVHIWQHWGMTKAVFKWKVLKRNKITFLTVIFFILLTFSIILFTFGVSEQFVNIHHTITSPLRLVIIIHLLTKAKRFVSLLK
jgi:hypothetical protein